MPNPFPGMDPYVEREAIWADFQASFVVQIKMALQPLLKPKYAAMIDGRTYREEMMRCSWGEEVRETFVKVVKAENIGKALSVIMPLSPANKVDGAGRENYLRTRAAFAAQPLNLTEIDLLRDGEPTAIRDVTLLKSLPSHNYLVATRRRDRGWQEVYPTSLRERLPTIAVLLDDSGPAIPLDLQAAVDKCWESGPYPELLHYEGPPPGRMHPEDVAWCEQLLAEKGFR